MGTQQEGEYDLRSRIPAGGQEMRPVQRTYLGKKAS